MLASKHLTMGLNSPGSEMARAVLEAAVAAAKALMGLL